MKLDTIIQTLARESPLADTDHSDLIKELLELRTSLSDKNINNQLLHNLVEKYTLVERNLISANQELSEKNDQIQKALTDRNHAYKCLNKELSDAADYIRTILPKPITDGSIRIDWRFIPSSSLGGDALGYHWLDEDDFAIYLIDVSGHGVRPALLSVSVINALRSQSLPNTNFKDPETVLNGLNKSFPSEQNNAMFFTIWYGVYNKRTRELNFASGGHPPAFLLNHSDTRAIEIKQLRTPNLIIGAFEDTIFENKKLLIQENSKLYIYSDGVYEIKQPDGKMWPFKEFTKFVSKFEFKTASNLDRLIEHVKNISHSNAFNDDLTIMEITFD